MIALFLNYDNAGRSSRTEKFQMKPRLCIHQGEVVFVTGNVGGQVQLIREDGSVFARRSKVTLLDDSIQPPRVIREDYPLKKLRSLARYQHRDKIPELMTNEAGDIVDRAGRVILEGPR
jgi:hypothetical protein